MINTDTLKGKGHYSQSYINSSNQNEKEKNRPLVIVDGKEMPYSTLDEISPESIESVSILKDAASSAVYGKDGSNSVILIKTKK